MDAMKRMLDRAAQGAVIQASMAAGLYTVVIAGLTVAALTSF